ncbi:MAG: carbohydrate-binding protein [Bryobacteraceae bacterium]
MKPLLALLVLCLPAGAAVPAGYKGQPFQAPQAIPGRLEAAYYDQGGEGISYHDTDRVNHGSGELNYQPGHCEAGVPASICHFRESEGVDISYVKHRADLNHPNFVKPDPGQLYIGWEADGEWTNYTVDVKKAGTYRIVALYSNGANTVKFSLNNKPAAECRLPMDTGFWHTWNKAACGEITFPETGIQLLTLHYNTGNNLAYFDFEPAGVPAPGKLAQFITRKGGALYEGDVPFRFLGLASPNLFLNEAQLLPDFGNRFPDEFELRDALTSLQQIGARATRTFTLTVYTPQDAAPVHLRGPRDYNEEAFRTLDKLLALCHEYDIRLILPFIDSHSFKGVRGVDEFAAFRHKPGPEFFTDPQLKQDFKDLIADLLNRRNTVSGLLYKDDPAILAWQPANEAMSYFPDRGKPNNEALITDWTLEVAAFIKTIDHNHLVLAAGGNAARYLDSSAIDILSEHYYEYWDKLGGGSGDIAARLDADAATYKGRKPLMADEFGMASTPMLTRFMDDLVHGEVVGGLLWSIRSHRRDGGFYYHNEAGSVFNSYHWPGFAAGAGSDEQAVLQLLRERAFAIRGHPVPDLPAPLSPPILFPVSPMGGLRWRGSTGASGYDIERGPSADGPWTLVAENVGDAIIDSGDVVGYESQWERAPVCTAPPLWKDSAAKGKGPFFYRMVARNRTGKSPYSNTVQFK